MNFLKSKIPGNGVARILTLRFWTYFQALLSFKRINIQSCIVKEVKAPISIPCCLRKNRSSASHWKLKETFEHWLYRFLAARKTIWLPNAPYKTLLEAFQIFLLYLTFGLCRALRSGTSNDLVKTCLRKCTRLDVKRKYSFLSSKKWVTIQW